MTCPVSNFDCLTLRSFMSMSVRKTAFSAALALVLVTQAYAQQQGAPQAPAPEHFKIEASGQAAIDAAKGVFGQGGRRDVMVPQATYFDEIPGFNGSIRSHDYHEAVAYY